MRQQTKALADGAKEVTTKFGDANNAIQKTIKQTIAESGKVKSSELISENIDYAKLNKINQAQQDFANKNRVVSDLLKQSGLGANELSMGLRNMGYTVSNNGAILDSFGRKIAMAEVNMQKLRKAAWRFDMNLLTLMFGFMALNRVVSQFGRSAITTYQKANEDTQGLGKVTWELQAAWEFLKYSLVDALSQSGLFQMLVKWIIQIVQWFNKLPQSFKSFIVFGIILVWIISLIGQWYAVLYPLFSYLATFIPYLADLLIGSLGATFWVVAAIVALVVAFWISNFGGFRDFVIQTLGIIWSWFVQVFGHLWEIVKIVLDIIVAIFNGDWDKVWKLTINLLKNLTAIFLKTFIGIGMVAANILIFAWNTIVDTAFKILLGGMAFLSYKINEGFINLGMGIVKAFSKPIDAVVAKLNNLISFWNRTVGKLTGMTISPFKFSSEISSGLEGELENNRKKYEEITKQITTMSDKLKAAYVTQEAFKNETAEVNKLLGLTATEAAPTTPTTAATTSKNVVDNSTKTVNINLPQGAVTDLDQLADLVMGKFEDSLNRTIDSVNN